MSEHKHFTGDRSTRHGRDDRTYIAPPPHARESYHDSDRYLSQDNEWNRRHTDHDEALYHSDQYLEDQHREYRYADDQFESDHSRDQYYSAPDNRHPEWSDTHCSQFDYTEIEDYPQGQTQNHFGFSEFDLQDIHHRGRRTWLKKIAGYGSTALLIGLVGILAYEFTPDPTPLDVIAMDEHLDNLNNTPSDPASLQANINPTTNITAENSSAQIATNSQTVTTASEKASFVNETEAPETSSAEVSEENESILEIQATNETPATNSSDITSLDAESYSTLIVLQQWSNVRRSPDIDGPIITALDVGKTVTKISQTGTWIEVQTDEQPSITGYMYHSTIAPQ